MVEQLSRLKIVTKPKTECRTDQQTRVAFLGAKLHSCMCSTRKSIYRFHTFQGGGVRTKSVKFHTYFLFFQMRPSLTNNFVTKYFTYHINKNIFPQRLKLRIGVIRQYQAGSTTHHYHDYKTRMLATMTDTDGLLYGLSQYNLCLA